jgi:hypothetical protein
MRTCRIDDIKASEPDEPALDSIDAGRPRTRVLDDDGAAQIGRKEPNAGPLGDEVTRSWGLPTVAVAAEVEGCACVG